MPLVNYCKKCRCEVPLGETCPHCAGKLTKTGEQLSFGMIHVPVKNWFCWNRMLRVAVPVWLLINAAALISEARNGGVNGIAALLEDGYAFKMLGLFAGMLLVIFAVLLAQGPEQVHYLLDRDGVHARTYLRSPGFLQLASRFASRSLLKKLEETDQRPPLPGLVQVNRQYLPWGKIRRVNIWKEGGSIQFYIPSFWEALSMPVPVQEMEAAEEYIERKMKSGKKRKTGKKK